MKWKSKNDISRSGSSWKSYNIHFYKKKKHKTMFALNFVKGVYGVDFYNTRYLHQIMEYPSLFFLFLLRNILTCDVQVVLFKGATL